MEITFGIVSEGVTDQIILENILFGWTGDKNLIANPLQPKKGESGNWDKVFKYCQSDDFKGAFAYCDMVVIQMDTDFMLRGEVPENYRIDMLNLSVGEAVEAFKNKIIDLMGVDFYRAYTNQIIFAISVNEIECWLLPMYFENQKVKAGKTENCIGTLNTILPQAEGFYIDEKRNEYYEKIARKFKKRKDIAKWAALNESFYMFIQELDNKLIIN
jgi:hypothetical protein